MGGDFFCVSMGELPRNNHRCTGEFFTGCYNKLFEVEFTDQMINEDESIALSNKYRIDVKKAIAANKYYEKNLWGSNKANIYTKAQNANGER